MYGTVPRCLINKDSSVSETSGEDAFLTHGFPHPGKLGILMLANMVFMNTFSLRWETGEALLGFDDLPSKSSIWGSQSRLRQSWGQSLMGVA